MFKVSTTISFKIIVFRDLTVCKWLEIFGRNRLLPSLVYRIRIWYFSKTSRVRIEWERGFEWWVFRALKRYALFLNPKTHVCLVGSATRAFEVPPTHTHRKHQKLWLTVLSVFQTGWKYLVNTFFFFQSRFLHGVQESSFKGSCRS